jgi:hypothetical protein
MKKLMWLAVLAFCWMCRAGGAHACSCERDMPAAGFDRAQYVFTGKVLNADHHEWQIGIERVWKGRERLGLIIKLKDAYAATDCEFFFQEGQRYLFFAIVAKGGKYVFYHPQVCNWTSPLQSTRVLSQSESLWIEDFIAREYGPGEPPRDAPSLQ